MTGWIVIGALAAVTYALKAAGPLVIGNRDLPPTLTWVATLMPAALLAALVVASGLGEGSSLRPDARLVGLLAAALALWRRAEFVVVVLVAAVATALARAAGLA